MDEARLDDDAMEGEFCDLIRQMTPAERAEFVRWAASYVARDRLGGLDLARVTHKVPFRGYLLGH